MKSKRCSRSVPELYFGALEGGQNTVCVVNAATDNSEFERKRISKKRDDTLHNGHRFGSSRFLTMLRTVFMSESHVTSCESKINTSTCRESSKPGCEAVSAFSSSSSSHHHNSLLSNSVSRPSGYVVSLPHTEPGGSGICAPPPLPKRTVVGKEARIHTEEILNVGKSNASGFLSAMEKLRSCGWYWGALNWQEAEEILKDKESGSFLVRDSSDEKFIFSLSFKGSSSVHHCRINQLKGKFCFGSPESSLGCSSIVEFVEKAVEYSADGRFHFFLHPHVGEYPAENIVLLHPVSRFVRLASLRHLCRFEILKHVRNDHIDALPVSQPVKEYLKDSRYLVEF